MHSLKTFTTTTLYVGGEGNTPFYNAKLWKINPDEKFSFSGG